MSHSREDNKIVLIPDATTGQLQFLHKKENKLITNPFFRAIATITNHKLFLKNNPDNIYGVSFDITYNDKPFTPEAEEDIRLTLKIGNEHHPIAQQQNIEELFFTSIRARRDILETIYSGLEENKKHKLAIKKTDNAFFMTFTTDFVTTLSDKTPAFLGQVSWAFKFDQDMGLELRSLTTTNEKILTQILQGVVEDALLEGRTHYLNTFSYKYYLEPETSLKTSNSPAIIDLRKSNWTYTPPKGFSLNEDIYRNLQVHGELFKNSPEFQQMYDLKIDKKTAIRHFVERKFKERQMYSPHLPNENFNILYEKLQGAYTQGMSGDIVAALSSLILDSFGPTDLALGITKGLNKKITNNLYLVENNQLHFDVMIEDLSVLDTTAKEQWKNDKLELPGKIFASFILENDGFRLRSIQPSNGLLRDLILGKKFAKNELLTKINAATKEEEQLETIRQLPAAERQEAIKKLQEIEEKITKMPTVQVVQSWTENFSEEEPTVTPLENDFNISITQSTETEEVDKIDSNHSSNRESLEVNREESESSPDIIYDDRSPSAIKKELDALRPKGPIANFIEKHPVWTGVIVAGTFLVAAALAVGIAIASAGIGAIAGGIAIGLGYLGIQVAVAGASTGILAAVLSAPVVAAAVISTGIYSIVTGIKALVNKYRDQPAISAPTSSAGRDQQFIREGLNTPPSSNPSTPRPSPNNSSEKNLNSSFKTKSLEPRKKSDNNLDEETNLSTPPPSPKRK